MGSAAGLSPSCWRGCKNTDVFKRSSYATHTRKEKDMVWKGLEWKEMKGGDRKEKREKERWNFDPPLRNLAEDDDQTRFTWYFLTILYSSLCLQAIAFLKCSYVGVSSSSILTKISFMHFLVVKNLYNCVHRQRNRHRKVDYHWCQRSRNQTFPG